MTSHTQAQLEEQRAATELIVQNSEALASLIGNTTNVADYVRQTAERCAADAQQVWRALMGVEDSDRVFILDRIIDHANWLNKLAIAVTSGNTTDELANHRNCKLGKWYFSPAGQEIRGRGGRITALFDQLDEPHQRLHDTGLAAIATARKGNTEEAQNLMLKAFEESVTVVDLLVSLAAEL
jgi:methyl-accepting chemotaxis protein